MKFDGATSLGGGGGWGASVFLQWAARNFVHNVFLVNSVKSCHSLMNFVMFKICNSSKVRSLVRSAWSCLFFLTLKLQHFVTRIKLILVIKGVSFESAASPAYAANHLQLFNSN